jgi:uncharacterized membrane protein YfcA
MDLFQDLSQGFNLSYYEWVLSFLCILIIGVSKSGLKGIAIAVVAVLAIIFGAKASTGILLPFLIAGDIIAVIYYKRHVQWHHLVKLLPWMVIGVLIGVWAGGELPEEGFKTSMAIIILISVVILIWWDRKNSDYIPDNKYFASLMGLIAGFTTMIGNMAGAFSNLYFLSMRLPKNQFIGTAAWLFFIINIFKVPFHIYVWETITMETFKLNLVLVVAVVLGFILGLKILSYIKEKLYRNLILVLTAVGALIMIFN